MKKIVITVAVVGILTLALAGLAYAQTTSPPEPEYPEGYYGSGRMGMRDGHDIDSWGRDHRAGEPANIEGFGPMHDEMMAAFAQIFDLSVDELEDRHDAGETMWDMAEDLGLTPEQFRELKIQARNQALAQAAADGVIPQEQYNWMLERMNQMWSGENHPDFTDCDGDGQRGFGRNSGLMFGDNTR